MKGISIFGGVQFINVIINIVRGKLVAMILGSTGMGVSSIFNSVSIPFQQMASLGLTSSAIKDISQNIDDHQNLSKVCSILRKMMMISSTIIALLVVIFSHTLSVVSFGTDKYTLAFVLLAFVIFINTLSSGETTILQGTRQLKSLAVRPIMGSIIGLVVGIPLYYWKGINGIVPAMLVLAISNYILNHTGTRKLKLDKKSINWKRVWIIGRPMVLMGLVLMLGSLIGNFTTYLLNAFIRYFGNLGDVGLYQAANSITNQYTGMIFAAMATDYYPRLASVVNQKTKMCEFVNQQAEIVLLVVTPLAMLLMLTAPLLIRILLTTEFLPIVNIIRLMGFSVIFRAFVFPMGYISFSKGDRKYFFWTEGIYTNLKTLLIFAISYKLYGLYGLGIGCVVSSLIDVVSVIVLTKWRFDFELSFEVIKMFIIFISIGIICLLGSYITNNYVSYIVMGICSMGSCVYSLRLLNKRLNINEILKRKWKKTD